MLYTNGVGLDRQGNLPRSHEKLSRVPPSKPDWQLSNLSVAKERFLNNLTASLVTGVLLLICAAARTDAQSPRTSVDAGTVDRLLQSNDAKDVAWGAFTASQRHLASAVPLLTAALTRELGGAADARRGAELAILDALVQLDARVPVDALRPSLARSPIPTLILLDKAVGNRDALLLERLSATSGSEWQAIANLLFKSKPPGFAFQLLDGLRLGLTFYVTDDPNSGYGSGLGVGVENGPENGRVVAGFPALAEYQFASFAAGAATLSIGPQTVYYIRRTRSPGLLPPQTHSAAATTRDFDRLQYMNALVREQFGAAPLRDQSSITIVWSSAQALRQDISEHRRSVEDSYRRAVSLLVSSNRLTEDESRRLRPAITIAVKDVRKDTAEPLPAIDERGAAAVRNPQPGPIRKIHDVRPVSPEPAQRANVRGMVIVEFTIARDGSVTDAVILRGIPLLNEAALDCVRQRRYEPVLLGGQAVPARMTEGVSFR
jgi:TonB family protein